MKKFKLLLLVALILTSCNLKEKNKQKILQHIEENEELYYSYEGAFEQANKEKIRVGFLAPSDYWIVIEFDEVILTPKKNSITTIKKDKYSKGTDYQNFSIDFLVTMTNINNQYFQFDNDEFRGLWLGTGTNSEYTPSHPDYDVLWSKDKKFTFEIDESNQYQLDFRAGVNYSMTPLFLRGFYTQDDVGNNYEVLFEVNLETKKIISKTFLRIEDKNT